MDRIEIKIYPRYLSNSAGYASESWRKNGLQI